MPGARRRRIAGTLAVTVATLAAAAFVGGCDWFEEPIAANLPPRTELTDCPSARNVQAGDDVTIEWTGDDPDGDVDHYEWSHSNEAGADTSGVTVEESFTIEGAAEGDHLFMVAAVDDKGDVDPDPATCEFTAAAGGGLVDRVVLVEFLTAVWCENCPDAEEALLNLLEEYGEENLSVVSYHYPPGSLWTPETRDAIVTYHDAEFSTSFPTSIFDGLVEENGAAQGVAEVQARYAFRIEQRMLVGSPLSLAVTGSMTEARGQVSVKVKVHDALTGGGGPNVLKIAVIENEIDLADENPPYEFVTRDLLDPETLMISAVGDSVVVERDIVIDPAWNVSNLSVIAFVQDDATLEIIQSGRLLNE